MDLEELGCKILGVVTLIFVMAFVIEFLCADILFIYEFIRRRWTTSLYPGTTSGGSNQQPPGRDHNGSSIISKLPKSVYTQSGGNLSHGEAMECSICLETLQKKDNIGVLPNCKHMFHVECIDLWLGSHTTCPICRAEVSSVKQLGHGGSSPRVQPSHQPPIIHESVV